MKISNIKENGINRIVFSIFLFFWFSFGSLLKYIHLTMEGKEVDTKILFIVLGLGIIHTMLLALFVYLRHKNADVKHKLATVLACVPIFYIAPIISGLWYKPKNSKGNIAYIKEKFNIIKDSGIPTVIATSSFLIGIGIGYIYNIVWLIDNWGHLETFSKFINVGLMIFIPPFGGILGIYHLF